MMFATPVAIALLAGSASNAFARPTSNAVAASISVPSSLHYGDSFSATWTAPKTVKNPVGLVACTANSTTLLSGAASGYIWSAYRFPQADGTIGVWTLDDPLNEEWIGGGADCTISLQVIASNGTVNTLAVKTFAVTG